MKNKKYLKIVSAKHLGEYKIEFNFNDRKRTVVDFYPFLASSLNPHIRKYLNLKFFKNFSVQQGELIWNDFDLCFPIIDLYQNTLMKESHLDIKKSA